MTYTDQIAGLNGYVATKPPCRVATTTNITLSGLQVIDGVTVIDGDRVLVKNQTDQTQNGIWLAGTNAWTRTRDFDGVRDAVSGTSVFVRAGSTNSLSQFVVSTDDDFVIGSSALAFTKISAPTGLDQPDFADASEAASFDLSDVSIEYFRTAGYAAPGDEGHGLYVRVGSEPSHAGKIQSADGAWWELAETGRVDWRVFGAATSNTGAQNKAKWDDAVSYCAAKGAILYISGGTFQTQGDLTTISGLTVEWTNDSCIAPQPLASPDYTGQASTTGAIITNLDPAESPTYSSAIQADVTLINPRMDGSAIVGSNAIGFARGMTRARVIGGNITNFAAHDGTEEGFGGKAVIFEMGCVDCHVLDTIAESCFVGFEAQGIDGTWSSGATKACRDFLIRGQANDCEAAVVLKTGTGTDGTLTTTPDDFRGSVDITFHNCGHIKTPDKNGLERTKGAPIIGMDAIATTIRARGRNDEDYPATTPGYNTFASDKADGGLAGPIGSVVLGWFRDCTIDVDYYGDADACLSLRRAFALADSGLSGTSEIEDIFRNDVRVHVNGAVTTLLRGELTNDELSGAIVSGSGADWVLDADTRSSITGDYVGRNFVSTGGTGSGQTIVIHAYDASTGTVTLASAPSPAFDATTTYSIAGASLSPVLTDITGEYDLRANSVSNFIHQSCKDYSAAYVRGGLMDGSVMFRETAQSVFDYINTAALAAIRMDGPEVDLGYFRITVDDGAGASFKPAQTDGLLIISGQTSGLREAVSFDVSSLGAASEKADLFTTASDFVEVSTGVASSATSTKLAVSPHTDGLIYFWNEIGSPQLLVGKIT